MKRFLILSLLFVFTMGVSAQGVFGVGDKKVDLTIGVGKVRHTGATFDQHVNMEWGVAKIADKFTIGVGFSVNNTYGGKVVGTIYGEYDYKYTQTHIGRVYNMREDRWVNTSETRKIRRHDTGSATADIKREDVNAMAIVSFHYSPIKKLDTYARLGLGIGCKTYLFKNIRDEKGFKKADEKIEINNNNMHGTTTFKYNDLDHVTWSGYKAKPAAAMALYVGATYYITDNWGVDAQIGMISSVLKKTYENSFAVFAVGASYKF
ncbi:MAG: hypothetical protein IKK64_02140 [Bacteroidales bacterium]|nr:hypothetical protein [Bacteroidales bacterium]